MLFISALSVSFAKADLHYVTTIPTENHLECQTQCRLFYTTLRASQNVSTHLSVLPVRLFANHNHCQEQLSALLLT